MWQKCRQKSLTAIAGSDKAIARDNVRRFANERHLYFLRFHKNYLDQSARAASQFVTLNSAVPSFKREENKKANRLQT